MLGIIGSFLFTLCVYHISNQAASQHSATFDLAIQKHGRSL